MEQKCKICGKKFNCSLFFIDYCSPKCLKEKNKNDIFELNKINNIIVDNRKHLYNKLTLERKRMKGQDVLFDRKYNCLNCDKTFTPIAGNQKFCCKVCGNKYNSNNKKEFESEKGQITRCTICNKEIIKRDQNNHLCDSKECKQISESNRYLNSHYDIEEDEIISIKELYEDDVYDIIGVEDNNNYVANGLIVHNSASDWAKKESKELKKKLAQVRTKHLLYILCFPLKIQKLEKTYLESFVNYWCDLFGRGKGAIYVKDKNPAMDSWRIKAFEKLGSYNEFTILSNVEKKLKMHPNFWQLIKFPKVPDKLYNEYLEIREKNVYDDENVFATVTKEDIQRALLVLSLRDIMTQDSTLTMNRIILHIKNQYDISLSKNAVSTLIDDSRQLISKIKGGLTNNGLKYE